MTPIEIIDIIDHQNKYSVQRMLVVDRMPEFIYERKGSGTLVGHDSGCFKFYGHETPYRTSRAFGGAEFDIPMVDGSNIHASGQWWDVFPAEYRDLVYSPGMNTIDGLARCHVFNGGIHIDCEIVDAWLEANEPSNNYDKYDTRSADYGKHTITSKWSQSNEDQDSTQDMQRSTPRKPPRTDVYL